MFKKAFILFPLAISLFSCTTRRVDETRYSIGDEVTGNYGETYIVKAVHSDDSQIYVDLYVKAAIEWMELGSARFYANIKCIPNPGDENHPYGYSPRSQDSTKGGITLHRGESTTLTYGFRYVGNQGYGYYEAKQFDFTFFDDREQTKRYWRLSNPLVKG